MSDSRGRSWVSWTAAAALAGSLALFWTTLLGSGPPTSSPILLDSSGHKPVADPAALPPAPHGGRCLRLAFAGDIMQHYAQASDDFKAVYQSVAPALRAFDLAVANLEFPVVPERPIGPEMGRVRFNGSPRHLDALADAGFDALATANNHSFDQGETGLRRTVDELRRRNLRAVGTAAEREALDTPSVFRLQGLRIGLAAFTRPLNTYTGPDGRPEWPPANLPVHVVNFLDWEGEYREQGLRLFREQEAAGRAAGADLLVAVVHWGDEWRLAATPDQQRAGRDLIDAGFDLVVGMHSHVLGPAEVYRGRLIAYSLGNFVSDFRPLATRTGAILAVRVTGDSGRAAVSGFRFHPTLVERGSRRVRLLGPPTNREEEAALALAYRVLGKAAVAVGDVAAGCR